MYNYGTPMWYPPPQQSGGMDIDAWIKFLKWQKKEGEERKKNEKPKPKSFNMIETFMLLMVFGPIVGIVQLMTLKGFSVLLPLLLK